MGDATVMVMVQVHAGDARHDGAGPEDHGNQSNALSGHRDVPGTCKGMDTSADPMESISTRQNTMQTQILPVGRDEAKSRSCVGMLNMQVDMHGVAYHMNMAGDMQEHVSISYITPSDLSCRSASTNFTYTKHRALAASALSGTSILCRYLE